MAAAPLASQDVCKWDSLSKYLSLIPEGQLVELSFEKMILDDTRNTFEDITEEVYSSSPEFSEAKSENISISLVKIAQDERQSSTESKNSMECSDEDQTFTKRSQPVIRSVTPRSSAPPMRRIQIGRPGSRRSTALTIKSLNYFSARERITSIRDSDDNNSGDEEPDKPAKKPETIMIRMSVQEAISLFESKQKDQILDVQKRGTSGEVSRSTNRTVLRRWSAGMGDSLTQKNASESISQSSHTNLVPEAENNKLADVKVESDIPPCNLNAIGSDTAWVFTSTEMEMMITPSNDSTAELVRSKAEEIDDIPATSAEGSRQKEPMLNQMSMKMMESSPVKYQGPKAGSVGSLSTLSEQTCSFYSQYKEKRDKKLRAENAKKHSEMQAQLKVLQETLKPSKADTALKYGVTTKKLDWSSNSQQPQRNSSPPVLHKKEVSKTAALKKASPKSSPLPTKHLSWSSGPLQKASGAQPVKSSPRVSTANTTLPHQKSQPASTTPPSPIPERPLYQPKGKREAKTDVKITVRGEGAIKQKTATITNKPAKKRVPSASGDASGSLMAKAGFYNKVMKKNSVVPLEAKPFSKKGTGFEASVSHVITEIRVTQSVASSKRSDVTIQAEEKKPTLETTESTAKITNLAEVDNGPKNSVELLVPEIQPDEDMGISSAAWVEVEHQDVSTAYDTDLSKAKISTAHEPTLISSPHFRHPFNQMLQSDGNEPVIIEWGNAENPPALIYHKVAPKGLKRLLKFARKSKGEADLTGSASPSVFSEGEDNTEDSKAVNKKNWDALRETALHAKGYSQQTIMLSESSCDGNLSKKAVDYHGIHDVLPVSPGSDKFQEGHVSSTKAARYGESNTGLRINANCGDGLQISYLPPDLLTISDG
ncbi:hypothetical protein OPV22_026419 [Ensete ventricosum]|uniref:Inner centromere protein ARK-binding domain-containing protein n=1 Tax=Ensete ventricosum TaxID=4639 RepID=A0AAV8PAQ0_ENSVE|nr:hypothetical protein OPV22_026419 [Ensete ventricosum]